MHILKQVQKLTVKAKALVEIIKKGSSSIYSADFHVAYIEYQIVKAVSAIKLCIHSAGGGTISLHNTGRCPACCENAVPTLTLIKGFVSERTHEW